MKNELKFKSFDILEKKADDSGNLIITGYGAVFGNVDSYNEIIERGAFTKTLIERQGRIAFCYQHDIWNPIGKIQEIREDEKGLFIRVMISAAERDIQTKIKEDILFEMSIGYKPIDSKPCQSMGYEDCKVLTEIKLIEISLVTVAANPLAVIEGMKGEEQLSYIEKEFDRLIAIVKNENISFEIQKLKALVFSVPAQSMPDPQKTEKAEIPTDATDLSADDILKLLFN